MSNHSTQRGLLVNDMFPSKLFWQSTLAVHGHTLNKDIRIKGGPFVVIVSVTTALQQTDGRLIENNTKQDELPRLSSQADHPEATQSLYSALKLSFQVGAVQHQSPPLGRHWAHGGNEGLLHPLFLYTDKEKHAVCTCHLLT